MSQTQTQTHAHENIFLPKQARIVRVDATGRRHRKRQTGGQDEAEGE